MHVFLSYSHADQALAARLRRALEKKGLSFNDPVETPATGTSWRQQVEEAIRSADAILLLLSSRKKVDEHQQITWMVALQAVWANPAKLMIPLLLQDAELPAFVRSGASGDFVQAIRLRNPKDLSPVIDAILQSLGVSRDEDRSFDDPDTDPGTKAGTGFPVEVAFDSGSIEIYPAVTDEDRVRYNERLSEIRRYAEQLKH